MTAPEQMLKPCPNPWCKGTMPPIKVTEVDADGRNVGLKVMCFYDCNLSGPVCATESEAITAWNTRPAPAELVEALRELEDANEALCAARSSVVYDFMIMHDQCTDELIALDEARSKARTALRNAGAPA